MIGTYMQKLNRKLLIFITLLKIFPH